MLRIFTLFLLSIPLIASPSFSPSMYKFQKDLGSPGNIGEGQTGRIILDEEIYLNSFYGDLRLMSGETPIPYQIKTVMNKNRPGEEITLKLLYKKQENESTIYVLELPSLPKDHIYSAIEVEDDNTYEANLQVSSGPSAKQMSFSTEVFLFNYGSEAQKRIIIGPTKHRFVRIVGPANSSIRFSHAIREKMQTSAYFLKDIEVPAAEINADLSVHSIPNQTRSPFTNLRLFFDEAKFERQIKIEAFRNERQWETVFDGLIFQTPDEEGYAFISLNGIISSSYRITIINGDNPRLHLNKIVQSQEKEALVFFLPPEGKVDENKGIKLFYGNRYAKSPIFDSNLIPTEDSERPVTLSLAGQMENPDFRFSIVEPPISGYIANGIFYVGILLLLGMGIMFYKKLNAKVLSS